LALAIVVSVPVAGCSAAATGPAASAASPGRAEPAGKLSPSITTASARSVLATYQIVNNTANARRDGRLEASVETVPQITIDRAAYDIQKLINQSYPPFSYGRPVFYIPALTAGARKWFTVDATTGSGRKTQHQLLLFVQPAPGGAWKLAAAPASGVGALLPVALSQAGSATMAAPDGSGLAVSPAQLPALQAGLLDGRRAAPDSRGGCGPAPWPGDPVLPELLRPVRLELPRHLGRR